MTTKEDIQDAIKKLNDKLVIKIISGDTFPYLQFNSCIKRVNESGVSVGEFVYAVRLELINDSSSDNNFTIIMTVSEEPISYQEYHCYPVTTFFKADLKTYALNILYLILSNSSISEISDLTKKILEKIFIDIYCLSK